MARLRRNKMIIAGLDNGGLVNSLLKWHRSGTYERLIEIRHGVTEAFSRNKHNPCNRSEPCLIKPVKWNIGVIDNN